MLPPTRPPLLIVPLPLGGFFFLLTTTFHSVAPNAYWCITMQKCIQSNFKNPHRLSQSQTCFKVQSLFWDTWQSLNCNPPIKIKTKKQIIYFNIMAQDMYYHSETQGREHSEEIRVKRKTKSQPSKLPTLQPVSGVKCSLDLQLFQLC